MARPSKIALNDLVNGWIVSKQLTTDSQGKRYEVECSRCGHKKEMYSKHIMRLPVHACNTAMGSRKGRGPSTKSMLTAQGRTMSAQEWATELGVPLSSIYKRINDRLNNPFARSMSDAEVIYGPKGAEIFRRTDHQMGAESARILEKIHDQVAKYVLPGAMKAAMDHIQQGLSDILDRELVPFIRTLTMTAAPLDTPTVPTTPAPETTGAPVPFIPNPNYRPKDTTEQPVFSPEGRTIGRDTGMSLPPLPEGYLTSEPEPKPERTVREIMDAIPPLVVKAKPTLNLSADVRMLNKLWDGSPLMIAEDLPPEITDQDLSSQCERIYASPWWHFYKENLRKKNGTIAAKMRGPTWDTLARTHDDYRLLDWVFRRTAWATAKHEQKWLATHFRDVRMRMMRGPFCARQFNELREGYALLVFLGATAVWMPSWDKSNDEEREWMRLALHRAAALGYHPLYHPNTVTNVQSIFRLPANTHPIYTRTMRLQDGKEISATNLTRALEHFFEGSDWETPNFYKAIGGYPQTLNKEPDHIPRYAYPRELGGPDLETLFTVEEKMSGERFKAMQICDAVFCCGRNAAKWVMGEKIDHTPAADWNLPFEIYFDESKPVDLLCHEEDLHLPYEII